MTEPIAQRHSVGGLASRALQLLVCALVLIAGCSGEAVTDSSAATSTASTTTSTSVAANTTAAPTTQPVDVVAVFEEALAASSENYRFQSVVSVGDTEVTTIQGVVDGESVAAEIAAGSSQVSYVRTPEGEWVSGPDEEWSALEGEAPVGPPLIGLGDVTELTLEATGEDSRTVLATLGQAAGPAAGARVSILIVDGLINQISYQAPWGADTASVVTSVSDVGAAGEVTPPPV